MLILFPRDASIIFDSPGENQLERFIEYKIGFRFRDNESTAIGLTEFSALAGLSKKSW